MKPFYLLFLFILLLACHKDDGPCQDPLNPECDNYDPCFAFVAPNADFSMIDSVSSPDCLDGLGKPGLSHEADTAWSGAYILFRALHEADTYVWKIGDDPRIFTQKEFSFGLPETLSPQDIPITLTTCKTDIANCVATKCDTLTKSIHLFFTDGTDSSSLVVGQFRGIDVDNPLDSFTITIPPPLPSLQGIINFPNGCIGQYLEVRVTRWGFVLYPTPTFCRSACGVGRLMEDRRTLVIDYSITEGGQRIRKQFFGRKM